MTVEFRPSGTSALPAGRGLRPGRCGRSRPRSMMLTSSASSRQKSRYCSTSRMAMPACVAQIADGAADILDDRRLDAFGRLVEHQQLRPHHQRAADGQLLLLAAGQVAAAPRQHLLQHRETARTHASGTLRSARFSGAKPDSRFSCTVSSGKISRPCGTNAMPDRARSYAALRSSAFPSKATLPARQPVMADDRSHQTGLADAVAAEHAGDLAGAAPSARRRAAPGRRRSGGWRP